MKHLLLIVFCFALPCQLMAQFSTEDTAMMSMAINLFRTNADSKYWLVNKSYDNEYRERADFTDSARKFFALDKSVPAKSRLEINAAAKHFKNADLPAFENAIMISIDSKEMELLCGIYSVSSGDERVDNKTDQKKPKTRAETEKETLLFYKEYYRLSDIQALEVSEPFYDRTMSNAIIFLTVFKHRLAKTWIVRFQKGKVSWKLKESKEVYAMDF